MERGSKLKKRIFADLIRFHPLFPRHPRSNFIFFLPQ